MKITIDGKEIITNEEATILEVAKQSDIDIPTLCYIKDKTSDFKCGLCLVEVEGHDNPILSCETQIHENMNITTKSDSLIKIRQEKLTTLAETHFGDCKAPCNLTCPGQINVQGYIAHIAKGQYEEALRLVMERNPFPFSVGRVCPRFCETRCRRLMVDGPVSINHLKRFVADWCMANKVDMKIPKNQFSGKKVAIIGGGPTGLTAAYFLAQKGHEVTVFEAESKLGGMLRYGIPEYKIPKNILDYEINTILRLGINIRLSQKWGVDYSLQDLQDQGFDAILISCGSAESKPLDIPGGALPGVIPASDFLNKVNKGEELNYGRKALVLGGNNIAMEVARSLTRSGVDDVTISYPRAKLEMPANQRNIKEAENEDVKFLLMASPTKITKTEKGLDVEFVRMKLGEPDKRGKRLPVAIPDSKIHKTVDTVVVSIGQSVVQNCFTGGALEELLEKSPTGNIKSNTRTFLTNQVNIFAAGDAASGPRTVIQSVSSGRRAAENIHAQIMAVEKEAAESRFNFTRGKSFDNVDLKNFEGINHKLREKMPERLPEIAIQDFDEVKLGFTEKMALKEAGRCLSCGCTAFDRCKLKELCIDNAINLNKTGMGTSPQYKKDLLHPAIAVDLDKCIYCNSCVKACEYDALDLSADAFDEKGRAKNISLIFNDKCVSCGKCVDNCSTGALNKKSQIIPIVSEKVKDVRTTCPYCGTGCQLILKVKGNTIMEVTADPEQTPNFGDLCVKGRFGSSFVQHPDRLTTPLIRRQKGGQLEPASWAEALDFMVGAFRCILADKGPDALAGLSSARCTTEENYAFQKFFRAQIGTNNVDHCARY